MPDVYTAPTDVMLPLDHPEPSSYITADEAKELNAWKKVWRDEIQFETLSERDATALVSEGGACHFFGRAKDGHNDQRRLRPRQQGRRVSLAMPRLPPAFHSTSLLHPSDEHV